MRPTNVDALTSSKYEADLQALLSSSKPLDTSNVADCLSGTGLGFYIPDVTGLVFTVVILPVSTAAAVCSYGTFMDATNLQRCSCGNVA